MTNYLLAVISSTLLNGALQQSLYHRFDVHSEFDYMVDAKGVDFQHLVKRRDLRQRSRVAVKQEANLDVLVVEPGFEHAVGD